MLLKIKQVRRWKKQTVAEQAGIARRFSGRLLWAVLLLGGIGGLVSLGMSPQTSSRNTSASFLEKADARLTAALPVRELFLKTLSNGVVATGGNRIGDVYLTNDRLLECPQSLDTAAMTASADAIDQFYQKYQIPTTVIAVPPAGEFYASDLLDGMSYPLQMPAIESFYQAIDSPIRKIDVYHVLFTATEDYIYYRTDEKWSCYGAYCVYRNAIQRMGFAPISYDQYVITHAGTFRGNLYDSCLYDRVTPDMIDVYSDEDGSKVTDMTAYPANGEPEQRELYQMQPDGTADLNTFYLGEPCEKLVIRTNLNNQKKLLLFKDDYADCMVPFLLQHYSEICILDVTQMEHGLSELADVSDYTQVLILCDADTFADTKTASAFREGKNT